MTTIQIELEKKPFKRWWGPYSPARGVTHGLRFREQRLGIIHRTAVGEEFWAVRENADVKALTQLILSEWRGGRLLFLPNGYIVKPLPGPDDERGKRVLVGRYKGDLVLESPSGRPLDLGRPWVSTPGEAWAGPDTMGLECVIEPNGGVKCKWYHPEELGRIDTPAQLFGADAMRHKAFCVAQPSKTSGRIHIFPSGHVIAKYELGHERWLARYVGKVDLRTLGDWSHWLE
jgi:hypothetical protein